MFIPLLFYCGELRENADHPVDGGDDDLCGARGVRHSAV